MESEPIAIGTASATAETTARTEDRILRVWTPFLLRTILIAATIILLAGLFLMATKAPGFFVQRYRAAQSGSFHQRESFRQILQLSLWGDPHSVLTLGLFVLTLVPLGRVAFCFLLFVVEKDWTYVGFTAYVLTGLIVGVVLGRVG